MSKTEVNKKHPYETPFVLLETSYKDVLMESDPTSTDMDNWISEDQFAGGQGQ